MPTIPHKLVESSSAPATGAGAVPAIELVDVVKHFPAQAGAVAAVEGVTLSIREGEFFSLLGPSGCGKTTTLRLVAGFEEPTGGSILLHGRDVVGVPPYRRDVNMVFQHYALFPHMDVFENVAFGLRRKKVPSGELRQRVMDMLELVELSGRERRRPRQLSGGQQQRVALARALVNRPRALLLDEPLGALDLKLRRAMQLELKRIQREVGITFVYVTHDQEEALTMSDRLVVMHQGRIEQLGAPRAMYERPGTRFVANFLGTSNIIAGRVGSSGTIELGPDERVVVPGSSPGAEVELTVRPEKTTLRPADDPPGDGASRLRGRVTEVVYLGTSTSYTVAATGGSTLAVYRQNLAPGDEREPGVGDDVWVSWRPEHSWLLEAPSTEGAQP